MTRLSPTDRFRLLHLTCPRLYSVLVRTTLALANHNDRDILLSWPFAKELGWTLTKPKSQWTRCTFEGGRVITVILTGLALTNLPGSIGQLAALQILWCGGNRFTRLPESLGQLTSLKSLECYDNQLTSLPESLGQLAALQYIWCHNNQLTSLPESFGQLTALQNLRCHNNQLADLPKLPVQCCVRP